MYLSLSLSLSLFECACVRVCMCVAVCAAQPMIDNDQRYISLRTTCLREVRTHHLGSASSSFLGCCGKLPLPLLYCYYNYNLNSLEGLVLLCLLLLLRQLNSRVRSCVVHRALFFPSFLPISHWFYFLFVF